MIICYSRCHHLFWSSILLDIVFANSTCFEDSLMRQLGDIAGERMKAGSR